MFDPTADADEKLREARKAFCRDYAHWRDQYAEMRLAERFVHNTDGTGQWEKADIEYLQEQGRPVLTVNVTAHKIDSVVGMHEDHKHRAIASPVGAEDGPLAEALEAVDARLCSMIDADAVDAEVYEGGITSGERCVHVDVDTDPKHPGWVRLREHVIDPTEIVWDPASKRRDRGDARYFYWPRWLSKSEFISEYPEKREKFDELVQNATGGRGGIEMGGGSEGSIHHQPERAYIEPTDSRLVRADAGLVRLVHVEYKVPKRRRWMVSATGEQREVTDDPEIETAAKALKEGGFSDMALGVRFVDTWDEEVRVLEFIGNEVLFDDVAPQPYSGFSVKTFVCKLDPQTSYAYSPVRHMKDPQRDVNKALSVSIEQMQSQAKPGYDVEQGAIPNGGTKEDIEENLSQSGSVVVWTDGALTGGKVKPRQVAQFSPAAVQRLQTALELHDRTSGIVMDAESPTRAAEAASTVQLRDRKALRAMQPVLRNFQRYQLAVKRARLETVINAMPDDQIAFLLGNDQRWQVQQGVLIDNEKQTQVPLREIRRMEVDVELEPAEDSDVQRLTHLNMLSQLAQQHGVPVDPEVLIELAAPSRSLRERLKNHVRMAMAQMSQAQQAEQGQQQAQVDALVQGEGMKSAARLLEAHEKVRHNRAQEMEAERKRETDSTIDLLSIWEKADDAEKSRFLTLLTHSMSAQQAQAPRLERVA